MWGDMKANDVLCFIYCKKKQYNCHRTMIEEKL